MALQWMCDGKGEIVPVLNEAPPHENAWGSEEIAPGILNLGNG
jgi:hypothetical protein